MFGANRTGDAATTLHKLTIIFKAEGEFYSPSCLLLYPIVVGLSRGVSQIAPLTMPIIAHFFADVKGERGDSGEIWG
jgi:hypothetical protein